MTNTHDQIHSLIAAYAIGAVPEEEIPAIRAHILTCDQCFGEAESYASSLAALTETVEPAPLSKDFADRVLKEALGDREPSAARTRWLPRLRPAALRAVAAVAIVALLAVSASYVRSVDRGRDYQRVLTALVRDPNALTLRGPGGAEAIIASTNEGTVLAAVDLGEAPDGRVYQLWLMDDGVPVPDITFDATDAVVIVESTRSLEDFDGAAVTVEPEGGSELPTTNPVLSS